MVGIKMELLSDFLRFAKEVLLQWTNLVGLASVLWAIIEKARGKEFSVRTVFIVIGLCLFFASFQAWREQFLKSQSRFTLSLIRYGVSKYTNELSADIQFMNSGTSRRTVLGVTLTYRSRDQNGQNLLTNTSTGSATFYDPSLPPLYVEPNEPVVQTYKYTMKGDVLDLLKQ